MITPFSDPKDNLFDGSYKLIDGCISGKVLLGSAVDACLYILQVRGEGPYWY